jgi:hypothetical protein
MSEDYKRGRGRPPGSANKPTILKKYEAMFDRVKDMMTPDKRDYYEKVFAGKAEVDPLQLGEFFTLLMTLLATATVNDAIEQKTLTQDSVQMVAQYRMLLKDVDDMKHRREERERKVKDNGKVVDPTRESEMDSVQAIFGRLAKE